MNTPDTNIAFRILDYILYPLMIFLGGFIFPAQESHPWNVKKWGWSERNGLQIKGMDKKAKFDHSAPFGLYHMQSLVVLLNTLLLKLSDLINIGMLAGPIIFKV